MSNERPKDAQKDLQWLRGWVSSQAVHKEFTATLQMHVLHAQRLRSDVIIQSQHSVIKSKNSNESESLKRVFSYHFYN